LSRTHVLVASASDFLANVSKVEFRATGGKLHVTVISTTVPTTFVWLGFWDTTRVANGTYTLQSVAYSIDGKKSISSSVVVRVDNH
jgi:phage major head subunit gpT-like protein